MGAAAKTELLLVNKYYEDILKQLNARITMGM